MELIITSLGGVCPVQAEGTINGKPFYFRARHGKWSLDIADSTFEAVDASMGGRASLCHAEGKDDTVGYMKDKDVLVILWDTAIATRFSSWAKKNGKEVEV